MNDWDTLEDAAAEASFWSSLETAAKQNKEAARDFVADRMRQQGIRGAVDTHVGTVNIPKSGQAVRVVDRAAFAAYVVEHHPLEVVDMERYYRDAFLKRVKCVEGTFVDRDGVVVPGVALESTNGYPKVVPTAGARELVAAALEQGRLSIAGIRPPLPEPTDRYTQDRAEAGL